jgi:hypothetical protein
LLKSYSFNLPIIAVGNLSVGGTGKTPQIEYLIRLLSDKYKVATLSRGYKRKSNGFILADANADSKKDREEIEAYIDSRLATLEVILNKTLDVISKGRDQLGGADTKHALSTLNK